jgi:hypothetical protein
VFTTVSLFAELIRLNCKFSAYFVFTTEFHYSLSPLTSTINSQPILCSQKEFSCLTQIINNYSTYPVFTVAFHYSLSSLSSSIYAPLILCSQQSFITSSAYSAHEQILLISCVYNIDLLLAELSHLNNKFSAYPALTRASYMTYK